MQGTGAAVRCAIFMKIPMRFIMIICSGREEELSFGLQYEAWMLEIRIPDWLEFSSKGQALKYGEQAEVSVFLKAEAIFLLFDGSKEKILPQQTDLYQFSYLKEKTYDRLGPPLSPEDIDHLVEVGELEQVLFSEKYILTEDDYQEFSGNLMEAFQELEKEYGPPPREKEQGYLFQALWYQAEELNPGEGDCFGD